MTDVHSADYYRGREEQERMLAARAIDPAIAAIHADLAERYAALSGRADRPRARPRLHVVA